MRFTNVRHTFKNVFKGKHRCSNLLQTFFDQVQNSGKPTTDVVLQLRDELTKLRSAVVSMRNAVEVIDELILMVSSWIPDKE